MTHLHIFALNQPLTLSHTNLTRQQGEAPALPPLAEWLGIEALDTDEVELFPVSELGDMALSDYIQLAFAPEHSISADLRTRLDALLGGVLLVPEMAMTGTPAPGPEATAIGTIALSQPDHTADLPKAEPAAPIPAPAPSPQHEAAPPIALYAFLGMAVFALLIFLFGWG